MGDVSKSPLTTACAFALGLLATGSAHAGLSEKLGWEASPAENPATAAAWYLTPPATARFVDERWEPILLIRSIYATTREEIIKEKNADGQNLELNSAKMDPSMFGHREGFILENVELGMKGRFNDSGFYYQGKFELVPREKDGNRSSDYLKDAYFGWNRYTLGGLQFGRMKIPFSQANQKATETNPLVYAPVLDTLVPKRQLGFKGWVSDPWGVLTVSGGAFNSVASAIEQLRSADELMFTGRADVRVHQLLSALGVQFLDFKWYLAANVAQTAKNFDPPTEHRWTGFDTHLHLWRFTVEAELVLKDYYSAPLSDGTLNSERGWGWHVDVTGIVWPEVIDAVFRYEELDGDSAVRGAGGNLAIDELAKQKKRWLTFGANLYVTREARLGVNYVKRDETEGFKFSNDTILVLMQFAI